MLHTLASSLLGEVYIEHVGAVPGKEVTVPKWAGVPWSFFCVLGIIIAYKGHGMARLSILMTYIITLTTIQLTLKYVMNYFPYPLFLSTMHFVFSVPAAFLLLHITGGSYPDVQILSPKFHSWYMRNIAPTVLALYLSIAMNNVSLSYIGAGLNGIISLGTPVVTALIARLFGMKIALFAWMGILLCIGGDAAVAWTGLSVSAAQGQNKQVFIVGCVLSFLAMGTRGLKTVLQDKLMNSYGDTEDTIKLTPLQNWILQGPLLITFGFAGTLLAEGSAPWKALPAFLASPVLRPLIGNVASAVIYNISAMYTIKMLGAPAAQIAGKLNVLIVAALSCAWFGETLTMKEALSAFLIIAGANMYEKAQRNDISKFETLLAQFQEERYGATQK